MAISKKDCLLLLTELSEQGIDCKQQIKYLINSDTVSLETLKFINDNRQLDLTNFYEKLRKSYNKKKSTLYINIVKELEEPNDVLTTLNSYSLQVMLYSKNVDNKRMFYKFTRIDEVYKCLLHYMTTYDLIPCIKLLQLIKADIKALENCYR